ncbi:NEK11 [Bugula neritina]|uniref:non-specific serine/threonine protein kinase n=1 Tax=Bugula neritina TaxID=10212 RepID=A0A7J7J192_BUGNE|nr:NEK11 [Bugula neritina]
MYVLEQEVQKSGGEAMELPKKIPRSVLSKSAKLSDTPDDKKRVVVNRYRIEKKLGSGNFGTAYLVKDLKTQDLNEQLKVLKQIPCGELQPDETVDAMHEAKLLSKLENPGIVKFYDSFLEGEFFCIVTEYCEGGDLDEYVVRMKKRGQTIPEKQVMDWTVELLMAVHYMHCRRVLHRDLKARNIFLRNNRIKIGDFGISRILMGTADMATTFTGTPYYMSPEVLKHEGYNSKSDVWSIGCIIYELCCHRHAFEGQGLMGVMYKIVEGECPSLPDKYSKNLHSILKKIFTKDPKERPSASEILKISFVSHHMEKMKLNSETDFNMNQAEDEAKAIELTLQKKYHMKDFQPKSEGGNVKHLTPRERMRLRKQEEADRKARELSEAARENLQGNMTRKQYFQERKKQSDPAPWSNNVRRENTFVPSTDATFTTTSTSFRPKTAPVEYDESEGSDNDDHAMTVMSQPLSRTVPANTTVILKSSRLLGTNFAADDRPITPMKDRMVYDVKHSSLDFRDGVPEDPRVAETYYSQFEEFEEDRDTSHESGNSGAVRDSFEGSEGGDEDEEKYETENEEEYVETPEEELTVVENEGTHHYRGTMGNKGTMKSGGTLKARGTLKAGGTLKAAVTLGYGEEEDEMIKHMENHLSTLKASNSDDNDYNEDTITLADDTVAGAFGPTARSIKIRNLRKNGESKLGKEAFKKAYEFLKHARYGDDGATSTVNYVQVCFKAVIRPSTIICE